MKQVDFISASNRIPRSYKKGGAKRAGRRALQNDWEAALAFQIRNVMLPLGFPPPVGRGFGDDKQFMFAKELNRKFSADYAWPRYRLLIEVQGGLWIGGGHVTGAGVERDIEKAQLVALLGYTLLPVGVKEIRSGRALELIQLVLEKLGCKPGASAAGGSHNPTGGRTSPTLAHEFDDPLP